jgi:peptidoglycan/xylan/chitin deacetylase (PgdA/CDA1 family)
MKIPVLMYHAVAWEQSLISISPDLFRQQMEWLYEQGYNAIPLSQLINNLNNQKNLPKNTIVLTFDDGFVNLFVHVFPILVKYGFSGTIFLVSGYCGQSNDWPGQPSNIPRMPLLNWDQIREMDEYGIEFGAHTVNHPILDQLEPAEIRREILNSKNTIEIQLSHKINTFAYPYGRFDKNIKDVLKSEFIGACTTKVGLVGIDNDPYEINRVDANYVKNPRIFRSMKNQTFPFYLYIRGLLRGIAQVALRRQYW